MRILLVHSGYQPRFRQLAAWFAGDPGNEVILASRRATAAPKGVRAVQFSTTRPGGEHCHRYLRDVEQAVLVGQAVTRLAAGLHLAGFRPDVVYGEGGSGVCAYLREVFTATRLVVAFGRYLRPEPWPASVGATADAPADAPARRPPPEADAACLQRARNGPNLVDLAQCDHGVVASRWALASFPALAEPVLSLLPDGVDERFFAPAGPGAGRPAGASHDVVTVACSQLAGGDRVDAVAPVLVELQRRSTCQVVVVGGDLRRGGPGPALGPWASRGVDVTRLRVIGPLAPSGRRDLLQASAAYVHLGPPDETAGPLEAMSCGCLVVVPDEGPTAEVVEHGRTGLRFPAGELAERPAVLGELVATALADPGQAAVLAKSAREAVLQAHRFGPALARHARLVEDVAGGRRGADVEGSVAGWRRGTSGAARAAGAA